MLGPNWLRRTTDADEHEDEEEEEEEERTMRMAMAVTMAMTITMVMTMSPLEAVARGRVLLAPEAVAREVAGEAVTMSPLEAVARAVAREVSDTPSRRDIRRGC